MVDALSSIRTRAQAPTPQNQQADTRQKLNNAGGFTFTISPMEQLRRFLTLGVDSGTFYVKARDLALQNARVVVELARTRPLDVVSEIVDISVSGRAPKQQPALFALAIVASMMEEDDDDKAVVELRRAGRRAALGALPRVARTGTHLLTFVRYAEQFRGWGRGMRDAVSHWYLDKSLNDVVYQVLKYRQREGWSHRDLLRLAHPARPGDEVTASLWSGLANWLCGRPDERIEEIPLLRAYLEVQEANVPTAVALIGRYPLSWEMLPDRLVTKPEVWEALLEAGVPPTALMRQLPRLTRMGLIAGNTASWTKKVAALLTDPERLARGRIHPISVLVAQRTYASGMSARGGSSWTPTQAIVDALDASFYASFGTVAPTGKRTMLALDVSGSMTWATIGNMPITPRDASAALALVTAAVEDQYEIVAFTSGSMYSRDGVEPLSISPRQRLDDVLHVIEQQYAGGTDCALPMIYAKNHKLDIDTFVIYTDNETWAGKIHPHQALRDYRERMGINAKLVVVGMTATEFSIADPSDPGMLDVAGFDEAVPSLISSFSRGILSPEEAGTES